MKQTSFQSSSDIDQHQRQLEIKIPVANSVPPPPNQPQLPPPTRRLTPNLPRRDLLTGLRPKYLEIGVPLYEASIKGDWKAAKAIIDKYPEIELVRCSITENGETALHVAASAKGSKHMKEFVKNLVGLMTEKDLELENENFNTAMYLAAVAGNIETVRIMVEKNRSLVKIPGGGGRMMSLYAAALFGNNKVIEFLYENSNKLCEEDGWTRQNRGWLLEKCVETNVFDVALEIVKKYPELGNGNILRLLAEKPEAFRETKSNFIERSITHLFSLMFITHQPSENKDQEPPASYGTKYNIIWSAIKSVFAFINSKVGAAEKENKALRLLRIIWQDIAKKPKREIDCIIRGPPDSIKEDKSAAGKVVRAIQLQKLISESLDKLEVQTRNIMKEQHNATSQDNQPRSHQNVYFGGDTLALGHIGYDQPRSIQVDQALHLRNLISGYLVDFHMEAQKLINQNYTTVSGKRDPALELEMLISEHIVNMHDETQNIIKQGSEKENQAQQLQIVISRYITRMRFGTILRDSYSSRVLFIAAEMGNTEFLIELIRGYPDLIWKVNDNKKTIFHIAVEHRHEGIYNLLYEIGAMKDLVSPIRDEHENTLLHFVGKIPKQKCLEEVSGAALKMQRELLWFKEVRNMVPPSYRERKNQDGLTASELFTKEHANLVTEGEKWMKETASQCMVVAALIATIVFAAAFTVPGGYNQDNGIPIFYEKVTFIAFVVADAISLFLSATSLLTFLSILTSRYAERDFIQSLPRKLMLGLVTLFLSITSMMVTFAVSFFILYHKEMRWIPIFIGVFAVLPAIGYVVLQYHLLVDVIRSTYGSRYLFKPEKRVLYYKPTI